MYRGDIPKDQKTIVSGGYGIVRYTRQYLPAYRPGQILNGPYWEIVVGPDIAYTLGAGVAVELESGPKARYRGSPLLTITVTPGSASRGWRWKRLRSIGFQRLWSCTTTMLGVPCPVSADGTGSGDRSRKEQLHLFQENLRYDKVAEGLGCYGEYVTEADELLPALRRCCDVAVTKRQPSLVNVQGKKEFWDPSVYPPGLLGKIEPGIGAYSY